MSFIIFSNYTDLKIIDPFSGRFIDLNFLYLFFDFISIESMLQSLSSKTFQDSKSLEWFLL